MSELRCSIRWRWTAAGKLAEGQPLTITDASGFSFTVQHHCTARELEILRAGGLLNLIKIKNQKTEA